MPNKSYFWWATLGKGQIDWKLEMKQRYNGNKVLAKTTSNWTMVDVAATPKGRGESEPEK